MPDGPTKFLDFIAREEWDFTHPVSYLEIPEYFLWSSSSGNYKLSENHWHGIGGYFKQLTADEEDNKMKHLYLEKYIFYS